jgi:hypothetical protein
MNLHKFKIRLKLLKRHVQSFLLLGTRLLTRLRRNLPLHRSTFLVPLSVSLLNKNITRLR